MDYKGEGEEFQQRGDATVSKLKIIVITAIVMLLAIAIFSALHPRP
jgi:hypothetical protein